MFHLALIKTLIGEEIYLEVELTMLYLIGDNMSCLQLKCKRWHWKLGLVGCLYSRLSGQQHREGHEGSVV